MRQRLRERKAERERRAQQAARRAEEILSVSSSKMRKVERGPREAVYRAEMLKRRIEGSSLRPRRPRSLELGAKSRHKPFQRRGLYAALYVATMLIALHPTRVRGKVILRTSPYTISAKFAGAGTISSRAPGDGTIPQFSVAKPFRAARSVT